MANKKIFGDQMMHLVLFIDGNAAFLDVIKKINIQLIKSY
jgi:hypothetical protein